MINNYPKGNWYFNKVVDKGTMGSYVCVVLMRIKVDVNIYA